MLRVTLKLPTVQSNLITRRRDEVAKVDQDDKVPSRCLAPTRAANQANLTKLAILKENKDTPRIMLGIDRSVVPYGVSSM